MNRILMNKWTKVVVFALCLVPIAVLVWQGPSGWSANPTQYLEHATGDWILRFLAITLAVTPLSKIFGLKQLVRFRRMLGLFAFFYACLHFTTYLWFDKLLDAHEIWKDVYKRPFITVGFTAFVLLVPLAITSTAGWIRRLGGRRWQMLHRAIYVSAVCGVIHYYWLVKSAVIRPLTYAGLVVLLLGWRAVDFLVRRRHASRAKPAVQPATF